MIILAVVAGVGVWLIWSVVDSTFLSPRAALRQDISAAKARVGTWQKAVDDHDRVRHAIESVSTMSLGGTGEEVDHRLRARLNRLCEAVGLQSVTVGTGRMVVRESPAKSKFRGDLADEVDLVEVEGWVSGQGTLAQVLELVDRLEVEPWICRVELLRLEAKDNGRRFMTRIDLRTIYLPDATVEEPVFAEYDSNRRAVVVAAAASNPFSVPQTEMSQPPPAQSPNEQTPSGQWLVTGVVQGSAGTEVWLRHDRTGESVQLVVGDQLGSLMLVAADGEWAEFKENERNFFVQLGTLLDEQRNARP